MGGAGPGAEQMVTVSGPEEALSGGVPKREVFGSQERVSEGILSQELGFYNLTTKHLPAGFRHFKRSSPKCPGLLALCAAGCSRMAG